MAIVYDVADFFIDIANKSLDNSMTNLKLNKLLYYSQGVHLARTGKVLFQDEIQAWEYGPVVPVIYRKYSSCGKDSITSVSEKYSSERFSSDELEVLLDVMREKGQYTGNKLVDFTHKESPWKDAFTPGVKDAVISTDSLKSYFTENPIERFKPSEETPKVKVLPKDWYDPKEDDVWKEYL